MSSIAILARPDDRIADRVAEIARARGVEVLRASLNEIGAGKPAAFDGEAWLFDGDELSSCDGVLVREYPAVGARLYQDPGEQRAAGEWWRLGLMQRERASFARSLIMDLELRGKRVVNPLVASEHFDQKPLQLAALARAGLPVPRTLVTNFPDAVRIFAGEVAEVVYKPVGGGAVARLVDQDVLSRLDELVATPVIFQERAAGADVRVTIVAGRVVSAVEIPTPELDYRSSEAYRAGEQVYVPVELPSGVAAQCLLAAATCRQVLSGVDLKRRADGAHVILEANSSPVYLDIERKTGARISEAIVDYLTGAV